MLAFVSVKHTISKKEEGVNFQRWNLTPSSPVEVNITNLFGQFYLQNYDK